ncbi:Endonuclease/exonuclease/phosphatase [Sesbania bispinosa]|nr:Endonuclease/exonuclease/phosphatase [Sesbania bispinosa]
MERWKGIRLNDDEEAHVVTLSDPEEGCSGKRTPTRFCLICKLWKINSYNVHAFKSTVLSIWKTRGGVEIMDLGSNLYSIALTNERDRDYILKGCPWSFDKYIVAMEPLNEDVQPSEIDLHECPFWIRIYDLPLNCRTGKVTRSIGENLGKFEDWDTTTEASMGTFLRIRVKIDLRKPLRQGMLTCLEVEGELDEGELQSLPYGVWMRASPLRPSRMSKEGLSYSPFISQRKLFQEEEVSTCVVAVKIAQTEGDVATEKKQKEIEVQRAQLELNMLQKSMENVGLKNHSDSIEDVTSVQKDEEKVDEVEACTNPLSPKDGRGVLGSMQCWAMITLSWNCRGLGNPRAVCTVQRLLRREDPHLVFLMETKCLLGEMKAIKRKVGYPNLIAVDCNGSGNRRAGGLAMMWKDALDLSLKTFSSNHISAECMDEEHQSYVVSGIYGYPEESRKHLTFQLLCNLAPQENVRWICFGDFNAITSQEEKKSGRVASFSQLQEFRSCLQLCGLHDMGFQGYPFTWSNGRDGVNQIEERLDRCCFTLEAKNYFQSSSVIHFGRMHSDHTPLRITWSKQLEVFEKRKEKLFKFEKIWIGDQKFTSCIQQAWRRLGAPCTERINATREQLNFLDKEVGSHMRHIRQLERKIKDLERWDPLPDNIAKQKKLLEEYDEVLRLHELYWQQRSRALWLQEGDKNTKFFHNKASMRQKHNTITKLKNDSGEWGVVGKQWVRSSNNISLKFLNPPVP